MHNNTENRTFTVLGMTCGHCKAAVETAIRQVANVRGVSVDLKAGKAIVIGDPPDAAIIAAVKEAGYEALITSAPS
jgi:copper chaperone